ncbi:peptidase T4 [Marinicauda salina]|uniref:Peptidase T4 n=1 Tax=Marinicauda salina TaxID=2135793 RepID=A0A2U2BXV3_9PROT|nr:P1 family peptidase [Marinicauda salina]PWE18809.1 peptidase T4 [Marinicauda salina]
MASPGPSNDLTDVAGLAVGQAEDAAARTGVTVILGDAPVVAAVDVRGGGPGTRETDALAPGGLVERADAVVLAGGSVYGLAAADAVAAKLGAAGRGFALMDMPGVPPSPIVPAAILFDLANGGDKTWGDEPPYRRLGAEAFDAVGGPVTLGRAGAGFGAQAGAHPGGAGSASLVSSDGATVAALACVNSFGSVTMPGCDAYWAWPLEIDGEFGGVRPPAGLAFDPEDWGAAKAEGAPRANTTLAVVATDVALTRDQARRVAVMAQDGLARAIRPAHAPFDGDVVFALSTERRALAEPAAYTVARIGQMAADCLARAIARGVHAARK